MRLTELNSFLESLSDDERSKYDNFLYDCDKGCQIDLTNKDEKTLTLVGVASKRINADAMRVFKIEDSYFRIDGYYDSWNGSNFEDASIQEVRPIEKTITVYE